MRFSKHSRILKFQTGIFLIYIYICSQQSIALLKSSIMNSSVFTTRFESLIFPEEELEKEDALQSRESMDKNLYSSFSPVGMATIQG